LYGIRLAKAINQVIESDIMIVQHADYQTVNKLKRLLYVLATSVPFVPNITKLSANINTTRGNLLQLLDYLDRAELLNLLKNAKKGDSYLTKPDKIYINNTNILFAIARENSNIGTLSELFFFNQLKNANHLVKSTKETDFLVDNTLSFEIGGKSKGNKQLKNVKNAYIAADNILIGYNNKIPLWLFGFLY